MTGVTTVRHQRRAERPTPTQDDAGDFRQRLLDGLAASITEDGYRNTTVADIVRRARTSRRTFYEHFSSKEECYVALITEASAEMIRRIVAAVDLEAPWPSQIRPAVEAWIASTESMPALTLSWMRDAPSLGAATYQLQRDILDSLSVMIQTLADNDTLRAAGVGPVSREIAVMLIGGLRELTATTLEEGGRLSDIAEVAIQAATALLGPRPSTDASDGRGALGHVPPVTPEHGRPAPAQERHRPPRRRRPSEHDPDVG